MRQLRAEWEKCYFEAALDEFGELDDCLLEERKSVSHLQVFDLLADIIEGFELKAQTYKNCLVYVAQVHALAEGT